VVVRVLNLGVVADSRMPAAEGPPGNNAHAGSARSLRVILEAEAPPKGQAHPLGVPGRGAG